MSDDAVSPETSPLLLCTSPSSYTKSRTQNCSILFSVYDERVMGLSTTQVCRSFKFTLEVLQYG